LQKRFSLTAITVKSWKHPPDFRVEKFIGSSRNSFWLENKIENLPNWFIFFVQTHEKP